MINEIFGYQFNNPELLLEALSHPSLCFKQDNSKSYERLEFLGDAVLGLIIIEHLIKRFPNEDEGDLAKRKAYLVSGETLAKIGDSLSLGSKIKMSISEDKHGGRENPHNIENALEATIAAIYLDSNLEVTKNIVLKHWEYYIVNMKEIPLDPKSQLQEELQKRGMKLPQYVLVEQTGPAHDLMFKVRINIQGYNEAIGTGKSKKEAEKEAAKEMLDYILI